jgi:hypothetical protein
MTDEPVQINALGPDRAAEQVEETRRYENNEQAFEDKQREAIKAQLAPNPTTDVDLAREAYGDDWQRRRGDRVIATADDGTEIMNHGGVAVDSSGHALGHASDPERAADLHDRLVNSPAATDADRYPVTQEARDRDNAKPTYDRLEEIPPNE